MLSITAHRTSFAALHRAGCWVLPNPWDVGSARVLEAAGFPALATTSSGLAASLGRRDGSVSLSDLVAHVEALVASVSVPIHVDAERCFGDDPAGVADAVHQLAEAGASGISIEDWNPTTGDFDPIGEAVDRVAAAGEAAHAHGVLLTARADHGFYRPIDEELVDEVVGRLAAYADAGADCLYAPGLTAAAHLERVVALGFPANALIRPGGPTVAQLGEWGVRRVSTGGLLAWAAYGALRDASRELATSGSVGFAADALTAAERKVFG